MNILGKKVLLRALERSDLPKLHKWSNDPEIWPLLHGWHYPYNQASTEDWIANLHTDTRNLRLGIEVKDEGLIGTANILDINMKDGNAFHGMLIGEPDHKRMGYAKDSVMAVMRYCFEELRLHRLDGSMIEYNIPSLKLYLNKCGWQEEGRKSGWYFRNGKRHDRVIVGVTKENYHRLIKETCYWDND